MKLKLAAAVAALAVAAAAGTASAAGTTAGTAINNTANVSYTVGSANFPNNPAVSPTIYVAQVTNFTIAWQDGANVPVAPGDASKAVKFLVTNTGNYTDKFTFDYANALAGDNFDPTFVSIYEDTSGDGFYGAGDNPVNVNTTQITIPAGTSRTFFVLNNIPVGQADGATGKTQLKASSVTAGGSATGTVIASGGPVPAGQGQGVDVVVGPAGPTQSADGTYVISAVTVHLTKTSSVYDSISTTHNKPIPGAVVTYTLTVNATGSGTATNVIVTDPIPANTAFNNNTIKYDGVAQTDSDNHLVVPLDKCDFNASSGNTITCYVGNMTNGETHTVEFKVTIQ